jgi:hypothetical protein
MRALLAMLLASGLLAACSIGAPLVDKQEPVEAGVAPIPCPPPPLCEALEEIETSTVSALAIGLSDCSPPHAAECPVPDAGVDDDAASPFQPIDHPLPGMQPSAADCSPPAPLLGLPEVSNCDDGRVDYVATMPPVALDEPTWSHSNLTIVASAALPIALHSPDLSNVFLRLEGPVQLTIDHTDTLIDLRIAGVETNAGAPSVAFSQVTGQGVAIGDADRGFPGMVSLRDVTFSDSVLAPRQLQLESASLSKVRVATQALSGTDGLLENVAIDSDTALLSAFDLKSVRMKSCHGLTLVADNIYNGGFSTCEGAGMIRLYESEILASAVDGAVESDGSHWETTRIGANSATSLVTFLSDLSAVRFCKPTNRLVLGEATSIMCSSCLRQLAEPAELCVVPGADRLLKFQGNACPLLRMGVPIADCVDPIPARVRPPLNAQEEH